MSHTISGNPIDLSLPALFRGKVRGIQRSGVHRHVSCLLMEDEEGTMFEAWTDNSTLAIKEAESVKEGDALFLRGYRANPVSSGRSYGGIRTPGASIAFVQVFDILRPVSVSDLPAKEREIAESFRNKEEKSAALTILHETTEMRLDDLIGELQRIRNEKGNLRVKRPGFGEGTMRSTDIHLQYRDDAIGEQIVSLC